MFNFKSFIKPELRKKSLTPIIKTFLSKKVAVLPSQSYLTSSPLIDNSLLSTSLPLIGKPFNFQNSYFFSARVTTREKQKFSLRPFFLKTV
tara:strand:+ start:3124 stop:3396 length:273 start_codon:yes stop_codon:yes gene_type:complete